MLGGKIDVCKMMVAMTNTCPRLLKALHMGFSLNTFTRTYLIHKENNKGTENRDDSSEVPQMVVGGAISRAKGFGS